MEDPKAWIGRSRTIADPMDPFAAQALVATLELDRPAPGLGDPLPPFWHWMHFREAARRSALGPDGHPATGSFLPKCPEPRRMWAGGRLRFAAPLPLGAPAEQRSTIAAVTAKQGRQGPLSFVTVRHEISGAIGLAVTEEQDIVYRTDPPPEAPRPQPPQAPRDEDAASAWSCDATVLFRYSALTFNGHRIHYDQEYARTVEGYAGLVVHGPLLATLLLEQARRMGVVPATFQFRATSPVLADEPFETCGRLGAEGLALWVRGADGRLAMTAEVRTATEGA
ncbi:MAG: MaoC family dehydratase N-terminal domain-containing protein [Pseudomonadota bacterium]